MALRNILFMGIVALAVISCQAETGDAESLKVKSRPQLQYDIIENLLNHNPYNKHVRPVGHNGTSDATVVTVNFFLRHILAVDEEAGTWKIQLIFRQQWQDERLAFNPSHPNIDRIPVPESFQNDIWVPDTFFSHEVDSGIQHKLLRPNSYLWLHPNGTVLSSNRLTLTLSCPQIRYTREPVCGMRVDSYGHTAKDIIYQWKESEPVQVPDTMLHTPWEVEKMSDNLLPKGYALKNIAFNADCTYVKPTVTWSCIQALFSFRKIDVCAA
jgi:hypothetical protein